MRVLVTGGAGYIGSHTCVELLNAGHEVVVFDNFYNSSMESVKRVEKITGKSIKFYEADMLDSAAMNKIFTENKIDAVIHFAGYKAVGESVHKPLEYYYNNLTGTLLLVEAMKKAGVKNIIFSSSATVYGEPEKLPLTEDMPHGAASSPYGATKMMQEEMFKDFHVADKDFSVILLRYFNPIGAHESGLIGEDPKGIPNNLVPYIAQVAVGKLPKLGIFGDDYDTADGTCLRDYIHVVDLARGHVLALKKFEEEPAVRIYNLGTGNGISVLEVFHAFEKACGKELAYEIKPRRDGDVPVCYADSSKAEKELGFKAEYGIERMCADSWRWQSMNPDGYRG